MLICSGLVFINSVSDTENHRMVRSGRHLKIIEIQPSCHGLESLTLDHVATWATTGLVPLTKELKGNMPCENWSGEVMGGWILNIVLLHSLQPYVYALNYFKSKSLQLSTTVNSSSSYVSCNSIQLLLHLIKIWIRYVVQNDWVSWVQL